MKYNELIQFDSVESIVVLKESSKQEYADQLINTYVISDRMAEVIDEIIIEQIQFNYPADNKGLLIVGNYGTGKSHLMGVISTIAEIDGSSSKLNNPRVAKRAEEIEGKFKVLRTELDGITMSFQEFVLSEITDYMQSIGVEYGLPELSKIRSNKDELMKIMAAFNEIYPNHGFLIIIDELLDYLRSRKEQEIILDLGFLRAMGEICRTSRFRFIAGIQEMLFDNPKFQFVAEQLNRVKERTEQAVIIREDIEYVVSKRLLKKNDKQKAIIREHIKKFTPLYEKLNEQLEKYVELFPIHPAYLSTFEKVIVAEKRVVLKTISNEMKKLLNQDLPNDQPGFISFDSYWPYLEEDKALKSIPNVKAVMAKANVLLDRIENAFTRPTYKPMAKRIVQALSVFRLTSDDIYSKVGITADELRDQLLLYAELPEMDTEFLRNTIESVLKEILKTVSWQYISVNEENGQYYLDLNKDIDVDNLIEQKAETLSNDQLDRYYFDILSEVTENKKTNTYVSGYRIWQYELPWYERKVTRPGYLFFGAPNERSTAQPERDFYIYMLPAFDKKHFKDEEKPDEVFFILDTKDEIFYKYMKLYAGAKEMAISATTGTKNLYEDKANYYLKLLTKWFRENMPTAYKMTYKGVTKKLAEWSFATPAQASVKDIIDAAADDCLTSWFNQKYFDYPVFNKVNTPITRESMRTTYIPEALNNIRQPKTKNGIAILDGLVLLDNNKVVAHKSGYAKWVLESLEAKGQGQVLNNSELIEVVQKYNNGNEELKKTVQFQLEPELFTVILVSLVYNGEIVITINGTTYDAMKFDELVKLPISEIAEFDHIKKPSELPIAALGELFDLFNISRGLLQQNALPTGVTQLNMKSREELEKVVTLNHKIKDGIPILESTLFDSSTINDYRGKLNDLKEFLQNIQIYDTPAKLKNFKYTAEELRNNIKTLFELKDSLTKLQEKALQIAKEADYLVKAQHQLPNNYEWHNKVEYALDALLEALRNNEDCVQELQNVKELRQEYQKIYLSLHDRARLTATEDNMKSALLNDGRLSALKQLSSIEIFSAQQLEHWQNKINDLKPCWNLTKEQLEHATICPHCKFRPKDEQHVQYHSLEQLDQELEDLLDSWTETLLSNFNHTEIKNNIDLLRFEHKELVQEFINNKKLSFPIEIKFIEAIKELLHGIEKVEITLADLESMMNNGNPLTVEELRTRFEKMLKETIGLKSNNNIRIMLKK